jgi:Icc-related predicted phosphoesterase
VKLLLTADLHFHIPWFDWLREIAPDYDLVAIGGDLLDLDSQQGMALQLIYLYEWVQYFLKRPTSLALCTGNHDFPSGAPLIYHGVPLPRNKLAILRQFASAKPWPQALKLSHQVAVDGDEKLFRFRSGEKLAVTCCPYRADGYVEQLRIQALPWLVLHHEPPANSLIATPKAGNLPFAQAIQRSKPAWSLSGHVHFTVGDHNHFFERIESTICFNCRQNPPGTLLPPQPNVIIIDTKRRQATWKRWITHNASEETTIEL